MAKVIALSGVESTGKTTLATMLAGRLRTRGLLAEFVHEPGASTPFPPTYLDEGIEGWVYLVANHISREIAVSSRKNVDWLIVDRTPLDFVVYYHARFERNALSTALEALAVEWTSHYDYVYLLQPQTEVYREDGHRIPQEKNTWRESVKSYLALTLEDAVDTKKLIYVAEETYRENSEWVYHDILHRCLGETRPKRAYDQVNMWLRQRGWDIVEIRAQGSNSLYRFHAPTDKDDIDMMVIVDGDADYAIKVRADFMAHREQLENIVQASLDVLVTPKGMEAHEL